MIYFCNACDFFKQLNYVYTKKQDRLRVRMLGQAVLSSRVASLLFAVVRFATTRHIMSDKCLHCSCFIFLTMCCLSVESCAKLTFITPVNNTLNILSDDWLNLTFNVNMENCEDHNYTLTIETFKKHGAEIHCKLILNKTSCTVTDNSDRQCRCRNKYVEHLKKVEEAGDMTYNVRWFTTGSNTTLSKGETSLKFRFSPRANEKQNEHLIYVIAAVCGLFLAAVVFVVIFSYKRKLRSSDSDFDKKPEAPTDQTTERQTGNEEVTAVSDGTESQQPREMGEYVSVPDPTYSEAWDHVTIIPPGVIKTPSEGPQNPPGKGQIPAGGVKVFVGMTPRVLSPQ